MQKLCRKINWSLLLHCLYILLHFIYEARNFWGNHRRPASPMTIWHAHMPCQTMASTAPETILIKTAELTSEYQNKRFKPLLKPELNCPWSYKSDEAVWISAEYFNMLATQHETSRTVQWYYSHSVWIMTQKHLINMLRFSVRSR